MKRLTRWIDNEKDIAIQGIDVTKDECMKKLALYEDAEEEGRLVYLPVKIGDYAYIPKGGEIYRNKVLSYFISDDSFLVCVEYHPNEASSSGQWLKASSVFARPEEAEAKLKEMETDNE